MTGGGKHKGGAEVEKSGDPDGSPPSHTFANLFQNHMAPNWLCPQPLFMYIFPRDSPFPFITYHNVKDMSSDGAGFVLGFNDLP